MNARNFLVKRVLACGCVVALAMAGCDGVVKDRVVSEAFRMAERPVEVVSIQDVVDELSSGETNEASRSIEGVIYAGDSEPFQVGAATFMLSELPDPDHGDGTIEHTDNCPFCRRKAAASTKAMVEFRDANGAVIRSTASDLFGLERGDQVIVTGKCRFDEVANVVTVNATAIHKP